ncbi:MAG: ribonuclease III [Pseudomonadota bacterium]|nr:ribonuclease III [Pseudomonadota bacterium]
MQSKNIEELISQKVKASDLYKDALTHRSAGNSNNERLEFLGDAVLGLIVGEYLYKKFPEDDEGGLSRKRAYLVRKETLQKIAQDNDLGSMLNLGKGERKSGGRNRASIISDALEAIIGVIFIIDGLIESQRFVLALFSNFLDNIPIEDDLKDPKTKLQEILQSRKNDLPTYETDELNQGEKERFLTRCIISQYSITEVGRGKSKRESQQDAALKTLEILKEKFKEK